MNAAALDSCSSSASSGLSRSSGSCLTAANSSSVAKGWDGGTQNPRPTPNDSDNPFPNAPHTTLGQTATASGGGSQSSCEAVSANQVNGALFRGSIPQGSCSSL